MQFFHLVYGNCMPGKGGKKEQITDLIQFCAEQKGFNLLGKLIIHGVTRDLLKRNSG